MDASGNNRYELLFMDDEGSAPAAPETTATKKQDKPAAQTSAAVSQKKAQPAKKANVAAEKENKSAVMNKNEAGRKAAGNVPANKTKQGATAPGANRNRQNGPYTGEGVRNVGFRSQNNNEVGDQRPFRRNFREGGGYNNAGGNEYSNEQRPRQYNRDRENRGPPRNRNGEGVFRTGKREFDRQSGSDKTGVKAIDKRDGAGAHNWGSAKQDIDDLNKPTTDAEATLTDKEESANDQSAEPVAVPEEEETKEFTLDEWKAMQSQTRTKPQFNIRKAGEGEDTSQWKKMVVLNKKKDEDSEEELEFDPSLYPQRVGRLQRIVDIQFNFKDGRRGGGSGFGRGRGRGAGGRPGGDRGRFDGDRPGGDRGRFEGDRPGGERGRFEGGRGGGDRGRFEGGRGGAPGEADRANLGRPRSYGERTRGGANQLKVDDERQFPTLS